MGFSAVPKILAEIDIKMRIHKRFIRCELICFCYSYDWLMWYKERILTTCRLINLNHFSRLTRLLGLPLGGVPNSKSRFVVTWVDSNGGCWCSMGRAVSHSSIDQKLPLGWPYCTVPNSTLWLTARGHYVIQDLHPFRVAHDGDNGFNLNLTDGNSWHDWLVLQLLLQPVPKLIIALATKYCVKLAK